MFVRLTKKKLLFKFVHLLNKELSIERFRIGLLNIQFFYSPAQYSTKLYSISICEFVIISYIMILNMFRFLFSSILKISSSL